MRLVLTGMSNIGKTYWSRKLEKSGFLRFGCDDLIENKLQKILMKKGFSGISGLAAWMGQPYEDKYAGNSSLYIGCEEEVMLQIVNVLKRMDGNMNVVIDTTGSLVYLRESLIKNLKAYAKFVYFDISPDIKKKMFESYLENPKPVIWGNSFKTNPGQRLDIALADSYMRLLDFRISRYKKYADITIEYDESRSNKFSAATLVKLAINNDKIPIHKE